MTKTLRRIFAMARVLLCDIPDGDDEFLATRIHGEHPTEHPTFGGRHPLQKLLNF